MKKLTLLCNPFRKEAPAREDLQRYEAVKNCHEKLEEYAPTPLVKLSSLAATLGIRSLYVKDESPRFGLNAFKGLGVSYAMHRILSQSPDRTHFVSCTDGNHGRALAYFCRKLELSCTIFMPKGSEERRVRAIEEFGARVIVTEMNYDDTVRHAAQFAAEQQACLVQDTAWEGYEEIPADIVLGYSSLIREALSQIGERPTHVFVQAGVGSLAGAVAGYLKDFYPQEKRPLLAVMEPDTVACLYESISAGNLVSIKGIPYTAMAGLNCGEANPAVFPLLRDTADFFIRCADELTFKGMQRAKHPCGEDIAFSSGESGAVGLGLLEEVLSNPLYDDEKKQLHLDESSVVLLISTEGELGDF